MIGHNLKRQSVACQLNLTPLFILVKLAAGSLDKREQSKFIFLFLNQNICCGYSKEPSYGDGAFEHPKHMLKLMDKKFFAILRSKILIISTYGLH